MDSRVHDRVDNAIQLFQVDINEKLADSFDKAENKIVAKMISTVHLLKTSADETMTIDLMGIEFSLNTNVRDNFANGSFVSSPNAKAQK